MVVFGVENITETISSAFSLITINKELIFENNISNIMRLGAFINYEFLNNYSSLDKNYSSYLIKVEIRVDYLSDKKELNYKTFEFLENAVICTYDNICDERYSLSTNIIDINTLDINQDKVYIYIVFICFIII